MHAIITITDGSDKRPKKYKVAYATQDEEKKLTGLKGEKFGVFEVASVEIKHKGNFVSFQHFASFYSGRRLQT